MRVLSVHRIAAIAWVTKLCLVERQSLETRQRRDGVSVAYVILVNQRCNRGEERISRPPAFMAPRNTGLKK